MALSWREAMGLQARSDFAVYKLLLRSRDVERCHQLHYFQMATEKLAKAFTTHPQRKPRASHMVAVKFLEVCKNTPQLRRFLGYGSDHVAFAEYIDLITPAVAAVQRLHPEAEMTQPNAEYPWEEREIEVPCLYSFREFDPATNEPLRLFMHLVERALLYLEQNPRP